MPEQEPTVQQALTRLPWALRQTAAGGVVELVVVDRAAQAVRAAAVPLLALAAQRLAARGTTAAPETIILQTLVLAAVVALVQ